MDLDKLNIHELVVIYRMLSGHPRLSAKNLFGKREKAVRAVKDMANYAINRVTALRLQDEGKNTEADRYLEICERIYQELPEFAQWRK
jgi:hypothetical protein